MRGGTFGGSDTRYSVFRLQERNSQRDRPISRARIIDAACGVQPQWEHLFQYPGNSTASVRKTNNSSDVKRSVLYLRRTPLMSNSILVHDELSSAMLWLTWIYSVSVVLLATGSADARPSRAAVGSEQFLEHGVGGGNLDASFLSGALTCKV